MVDKKPLYQPWNEDEFQSGRPARSMNHIQKWMYRALLQSCFFCQTSPFIPDDDKVLWVLAGCGSPAEWKENREAVLGDWFDPHPDNPGLISHHRVLKDWKRLTDYRDKMKEMGKKSAEARATFNVGSTQVERTLNVGSAHVEQKKRKETIRDVEGKLNENETIETEGEMSLKTNITDKCREILHTRIQTGDQSWAEVSSLARVYGASAVTEAFETWARASAGDSINYPLSVFVSKADAILAGEIQVANPILPELVNDLVYLSNGAITFDKKQVAVLGRLLETNSPSALKEAFREFFAGVQGDDFLIKHASRKFTETAEQLLTLQKRRKAEALSQQAMIDRVSQEGEARAAEELRIAREKSESELEEIPDSLV